MNIMKKQCCENRLWIPCWLLFFAITFSSCINNSAELQPSSTSGEAFGKAYTDFAGSMAYEFNMIRNPVSENIPVGSFTGELEQARSIYAKQLASNQNNFGTPYTFQGPDNLGGRTRAIAYDVRFDGTTNRVILAGGASGGVYKSTDNGATWLRTSPIGEHFSCTSIAQDTRVGMRDTWYYTVGESIGNSAGLPGSFYLGNGVYKSTDNGSSWSRLTASNTSALETFSVPEDLISKIIVDPTDGYIYVACVAAIRRSTDGGTTWLTVLSGPLGSSGQVTDIVVSASGRLYAAFGGTNDSSVDGVWASAPGGTSGDPGTWVQIAGAGAGGSPVGWNSEPFYGRVVLTIPPSDPIKLYALYYIGATSACGAPFAEAELFRWDDGGATWTNLSAGLPDEGGCLAGNDPFAVQGGYDLVISAKPDDASTLFLGGTNAYRSTDAGVSWIRIGGYASAASYILYTSSHPDIHAFVFQPGLSTTMLCSNDGGIQRTTDNLAGTVAWTQINSGYHTYQFYHVAIDPRLANTKVIGGTQDNGTVRNIGGIGTGFEAVFGGDGVSVGLTDLIGGIQYEYVGSQLGSIYRRDATLGSGSATTITPTGEAGTGLFVTLFKLDADNHEFLYYANDEVLYRTSSASTVTSGTWTSFPGVATAVTGARKITALATTRGTYSPVTASLFIGASDVTTPLSTPPKLFRYDDPALSAPGAAPVDISGASFPVGAYISSIAVNPRNDDTVLVTFSTYGVTSVFWTGTANAAVPTWTAVEGTLTLPSYRSSVIAVTTAGIEYFVGTSAGLFTTTGLPGSPSWTQEGATEVGNAVVSSLALRPADNRLLVGTHGYGMWATSLPIPIVPVTLTEFKGSLQNKNVLLQWSTSTESNSKHFELEKSFDGINYRKIATIPAAGFSNTVKKYSFVDFEKQSDKIYYRLRSVDNDYTEKLSNTVLIKPPGLEQDMIVLGNPFRNDINIRFLKATESSGDLRLLDMSGRVIAIQKFAAGEIQIRFIIPAAKLSSGAYQLLAIINNNKYLKQVLKE